jgi:hypothetical protein
MSIEHSPARTVRSTFNNEPFVTEQKAAEFLNISVRTLQRWRSEPPIGGGICFYRLGPKRILYRISDCAAWAESRVLNSTSEDPVDKQPDGEIASHIENKIGEIK